jgi:hypothetical protein
MSAAHIGALRQLEKDHLMRFCNKCTDLIKTRLYEGDIPIEHLEDGELMYKIRRFFFDRPCSKHGFWPEKPRDSYCGPDPDFCDPDPDFEFPPYEEDEKDLEDK